MAEPAWLRTVYYAVSCSDANQAAFAKTCTQHMLGILQAPVSISFSWVLYPRKDVVNFVQCTFRTFRVVGVGGVAVSRTFL